VFIYTYIHIHICTYIYIYIHIRIRIYILPLITEAPIMSDFEENRDEGRVDDDNDDGCGGVELLMK